MQHVDILDFLAGYEDGYISDVVFIKDKVYGKDPRGMSESGRTYKVVWADVP